MPLQKILKYRCLEILFSPFPRQYLGLNLRTIKINYVYYNRPFPQNLNHWVLEKSEIINLDLDADLKKYIQRFKFKLSF